MASNDAGFGGLKVSHVQIKQKIKKKENGLFWIALYLFFSYFLSPIKFLKNLTNFIYFTWEG
jgi:hypothetical protein